MPAPHSEPPTSNRSALVTAWTVLREYTPDTWTILIRERRYARSTIVSAHQALTQADRWAGYSKEIEQHLFRSVGPTKSALVLVCREISTIWGCRAPSRQIAHDMAGAA